jgi:4-hydroxy-2-oxoheptanedioate aldolase
MTALAENGFKLGLKERRRQIGFWLYSSSPTITELCAGCGFDWLLVDMEHTHTEIGDIVEHLRAAGTRTEVMVRLPWNDPVTVKRILDAGARNLLIPYVQTGEEALKAVAATRYAPVGMRGVAGGQRASDYGRVEGYLHKAHENIAVIIQIETVEGLRNAEEIAATPGLDGIFIGPNDLAASMGFLGQPDHPEVRAAVATGLQAILAGGKAAGTINFDSAGAQRLLDDGFSFVAVGGDINLLSTSASRLAASFQA